VERGYIEAEVISSPSDILSVGAIAEWYDAEQKKFLLILTKEDGSTQTHEQSDYTYFVWEKYADIIAASSGQQSINPTVSYFQRNRVMPWKMKNGYFVRSAKTRHEPRYVLVLHLRTFRCSAINANGKR